MSLNYEMAKYTELTGEDGTKVSVSRLGGFLDGYEKGKQDAIDEHFTKIMSFINTNNRGNCDYFIVDQIENYILEQLKEKKNDKK